MKPFFILVSHIFFCEDYIVSQEVNICITQMRLWNLILPHQDAGVLMCIFIFVFLCSLTKIPTAVHYITATAFTFSCCFTHPSSICHEIYFKDFNNLNSLMYRFFFFFFVLVFLKWDKIWVISIKGILLNTPWFSYANMFPSFSVNKLIYCINVDAVMWCNYIQCW